MKTLQAKENIQKKTEQLHSEADFMEAHGIEGFYDPFAETEKPSEVILYES